MTINIAREFTEHPGPRYKDQGPGSGEEFRERFLLPGFRKVQRAQEELLVQLDGVEFGYPTSFLEEAFGGVARELGIDVVKETLKLESTSEPLLIEEIWHYVDTANRGTAPI